MKTYKEWKIAHLAGRHLPARQGSPRDWRRLPLPPPAPLQIAPQPPLRRFVQPQQALGKKYQKIT